MGRGSQNARVAPNMQQGTSSPELKRTEKGQIGCPTNADQVGNEKTEKNPKSKQRSLLQGDGGKGGEL